MKRLIFLTRNCQCGYGMDERSVDDPIVQTTMVTTIAFIFCLGPAAMEHPISSILSLDLNGWLAIIWYGLFVTAIGYILWYAGIRRCDASAAAAFSGFMPLTSMLLPVLLLGEKTGCQQWLGGLLVIIGILLTGLDLPSRGKNYDCNKQAWRP